MDYMSQKGIFDPAEQHSDVIIMGCGSTGSFIALTLAKMGIEKITCIDFDKVEEHNIPNQFFREQDIGKFKVEAIKEIIKDFTGIEINAVNTKIDNDTQFDINLNSIVILCFDNMESRKLVYEKIKDMPIKLIDTRMGGEGYQIYSIDLSDDNQKQFYETCLNAETIEAPCGQKSVIYTILSLTAETCNIVKKIDKGESYPKIIKRELKTYKILTDQNEEI